MHARASLRSRLRVLAATLAVLGVVACGGSPAESLQNAESWAATARLVIDQRLAGSTSATFTADALQRTADEASSLAKSLDDAELPPDDRLRAGAATRALAVLATRAATAAEQRRDQELARARTGLDSLRDALAALADRAEQREESQ